VKITYYCGKKINTTHRYPKQGSVGAFGMRLKSHQTSRHMSCRCGRVWPIAPPPNSWDSRRPQSLMRAWPRTHKRTVTAHTGIKQYHSVNPKPPVCPKTRQRGDGTRRSWSGTTKEGGGGREAVGIKGAEGTTTYRELGKKVATLPVACHSQLAVPNIWRTELHRVVGIKLFKGHQVKPK